MTEAELGWTAGIVDGEGSIGVYPSNRGHLRLAIQVGTTSEKTARKLQSLWGGGVSHHTKVSGRKRVWVWGVSTKAASVFLQTIENHLVEKADQARTAIEFSDTTGSRGCSDGRRVPDSVKNRREELAQELRRLKRCG